MDVLILREKNVPAFDTPFELYYLVDAKEEIELDEEKLEKDIDNIIYQLKEKDKYKDVDWVKMVNIAVDMVLKK